MGHQLLRQTHTHTHIRRAIPIHQKKKTHGFLLNINKATRYAEDTTHIRRYKVTRNSYKHIYKHHPVLGVYAMKYGLCLAAYTMIWHSRQYIYIYIFIYLFICGPGSLVGIATDYGLEGPGSNPGEDKIFRPSRPALGPTQSPVKWVPGLSQG